MFEWSQGASLRAMADAQVPEAVFDDWLEGWMSAFLQCRFDFHLPVEMLDIELGDGERTYVERLRRRGLAVSTASSKLIAERHLTAEHEREYDLVTVLSLEREKCLRPLDLADPLAFVEMLLNAATLLKPGGALIWSYLYCFSSSPEHVHSLLEPAAVYQTFVRRKFRPLTENRHGTGRIAMLNAGDTLFVRQKPILAVADQHERVTRILAGVSRGGANCRVRYRSLNESFADPQVDAAGTPTGAADK